MTEYNIKKFHISEIELFVVFIGFSIITSLWTSIGTNLLSKYIPKAEGLWSTVGVAIILTFAFAWLVSKIGFNVTSLA